MPGARRGTFGNAGARPAPRTRFVPFETARRPMASAGTAKVAELVDAPALGAGGAARGGSSPPFRTTIRNIARIRRTCKPVWRRSASSSAGSTCRFRVAEIESEVEKRLARLAKNVKVPGFRPGKVPMKMVAQQYGPQVRTDVITDAVQSRFADAMRDAERARRRLSAHRAARPTPRRRTSSSSRRCSRSIRISGSATCRPSTIERPVAEVGPDDVAPHDRRAAQAADALRARDARRGRDRRSRRSSISPAASTASSSRAARRRISRSSSARAGCCPSSRRRSPG